MSTTVTVIGYLELCPLSCCLTGPCKSAIINLISSVNYKQIKAKLYKGHGGFFNGNRRVEPVGSKKYKGHGTYKYWRALRFAKEGDISPVKPLKDMFLHRANIQWVSLYKYIAIHT
jgi:hypothetical protein